MNFRVMSWIPVEPDDEVPLPETLEEAINDIRQAQMMQPENRYEAQIQNEEGGEWERVPAWMYASFD